MLKCPKCNSGDTVVVDPRDHGDYIRRRRECFICGFRQTTFERAEPKRGLLEENAKRVAEYRKHYPKDTRSDEKILKALIKVDGVSYMKLVYEFVWLEGQVKG